MNLAEYAGYDALGLAELVRAKQVSPVELVETCLAAIEAVNPKVNAISQNLGERALKAAQAPIPDGPFRGVPFLLKDVSVSLEGVRTLAGSRMMLNAPIAKSDSELVARFKRAGLLICGMTTTPEFGGSATTEVDLTGITHNPWDLDRSPGGSSGGSAAAAAAGIVPAAQGGDGGGSLRIPGACCHLFAMKATRQRFPTGPDGGDTFQGMSVAGLLTHTVRDSAALMDAASGPDPGAPYWAPQPSRPYVDEIGADPGRLRIAVAEQSFVGEPIDPACRAAVREAAKLLEDLGHTVEEDQPVYDAEAFHQAIRALLLGGVEFAITELGKALKVTPGPDNLERLTWLMMQDGRGRSASEFIRASQVLGVLGRKVGAFFERYDVLLTPSMALPPVPIGYLKPGDDTVESYMRRAAAYLPFQPLFNAVGAPAANVPFTFNDEGLPIGIQIGARLGEEAMLFRLASQIEAARPWRTRTPPVHVSR